MADKKAPEEKYRHIHVMLPPAIAELVKRLSESTFRSQGQVITDALLAHYGYKRED